MIKYIIAPLQTNKSPGPDGLTLEQNKINFENTVLLKNSV